MSGLPGPERPVVLVLRALNLGDLLVTVPALRALRRHFPRHDLVLAASPALAPMAEATGAVDRLLPHRGLLAPALHRPDVAVDLTGVLPGSVNALRGTEPGRLVAFRCPEAGHPDGPEPRPDEHEVHRWCRLVATTGAVPDPTELLLPSPPVPSRHAGVTVVHPGAAWGSKCWPADRFAAVARRLAARGHDVVVTGSAREAPLTADVVRHAGLGPGADLGGRTTLADLMALVAAARLVVTGDTGTAHLATAYARPSVVLFGPASPRLWGPPDRPWHRAIWYGTHEREVLVDDPDPALLAVPVSAVLAATDDVLTHSQPTG